MNYLNCGLWDLVFKWERNIDELMTGKVDVNGYEIRMSQYWDDVMRMLQQRPEESEILFQDQYPLERYLNRDYEDDIEDILCPPPQIIRKLIDCNPSAACVVDDEGNTVLHRFCLYSSCSLLSFEIIQILHEAYPEATETPNTNEDIPLHNYMWSNEHQNDFFILPFLINRTPYHFLLKRNCSGETPLDSLCLRMGLIFQSSSNSADFHLSSYVLDRHCPTIDAQIRDTWMDIIKLVSFASTIIMNLHYCQDSIPWEKTCEHSLMELHSSVFFQLPRYFLQLTMAFFPHQLTIRDPCLDMSTPLGIAVSSKIFNSGNAIDRQIDRLKKRFMIQLMLEQNPKITTIQCTNNLVLPLHLSLYAGNVLYHDDAIDLLIQADLRTLTIRDPQHHFYPFLLAACSKPQYRECNFDENEEIEVQHFETVYSLLREVPWLVEHFVPK